MEGCRSARQAFLPMACNPCARPMETVVFPSPEGVGVMAETRMSLPGCGRLVQYFQRNLGLVVAEGDHVVFIDAQLVDTIGECRCDHECMMTEAPSFCKKVHGHSCGGNVDVFNHHGSGPREILGSRRYGQRVRGRGKIGRCRHRCFSNRGSVSFHYVF